MVPEKAVPHYCRRNDWRLVRGPQHPSTGLEQPREQEGRGIELGFEGTQELVNY